MESKNNKSFVEQVERDVYFFNQGFKSGTEEAFRWRDIFEEPIPDPDMPVLTKISAEDAPLVKTGDWVDKHACTYRYWRPINLEEDNY
ncbi:MAG: hypothetical protein WC914_00075 [Proteiniphilum sp.]